MAANYTGTIEAMIMDMNELLDLRARFLAAKVNKHSIGAAAGYAAVLEKEAGPVDFHGPKHSAAHLLALVEKAIRVHNAPKPPEKPKPKVEASSEAKVETKVVTTKTPRAKAKA